MQLGQTGHDLLPEDLVPAQSDDLERRHTKKIVDSASSLDCSVRRRGRYGLDLSFRAFASREGVPYV